MVPQPILFEHAKYGHASAGFAIIVLDHLISADQPPRIMRDLGRFLVPLEFGQKGPRPISRAA